MSRVSKNPDKWIRLEIYNRLNNMLVVMVANGEQQQLLIPCVDVNFTGNEQPLYYVAMSTQTKRDNQTAKCGWEWDCTMLLDVITRYPGAGNTGTRLLLNDIEDKIIRLMDNFFISGGFTINEEIELEESSGLDGHTGTEVYFRQLMRYRIRVTEN
jgi:hypothetical protein